MNNFKKFMAITSCAVILFSFAACGKKAADDATTTAAPTTQATTAEPVTTIHPTQNERIKSADKLVVWENGKKVEYTAKKDIKKVDLTAASVNDSSRKGDKFSAYTKAITEADIDAMKKSGSCFELVYKEDQSHKYLGEEVSYDTIIIATSGDHVNTLFFIKDKKLVGKPVYVEKGAQNEKALSERVVSSIASK